MEPAAQPPQLRIGHDFYDHFLKSDISAVFEARHCVIFVLPLPFQLPLKDNTCFRTMFTNLATAFLFDKYETVSHEATFPHSAIPHAEIRTRVEMAAFFPETPAVRGMTDFTQLTDDSYTFLYRHAYHLMRRLNNYTYAYRMLFEDCKTYSVSPQQFFHAHTQVHSLPDWATQMSGPLVLNANPFNYERIMFNVNDQHANAIEFLGMHIDQTQGEFVSSSQLFADARRYLYRGYFREAVAFLGMSSESFLNGLFRHLRKADGAPDTEIEAAFEEIPFMSRLKRYISHGLGGDWNLDNRSPVAQWKTDVYELRNRVVHRGYSPEHHEAAKAFLTLVAFVAFLRKRVEAKKKSLADAHEELTKLPEFFLHGKELDTFDLS